MIIIRFILVVLMLSIIPISLLMDPSFFWENYPVEMSQNLVLALGCLVSLYWMFKERYNKGIWFTAGILFFIALLRELSWGRVLFVKGMSIDGPIIAEKTEVWFGPYVNIFAGCLIIILLISIICNYKSIIKLIKLLIKDKQSCMYIGILVVSLAMASLLFDRDVISFVTNWHQGLEEMSELTSYWAAIVLAVRTHQLLKRKCLQQK